jgi:hypothetical protein
LLNIDGVKTDPPRNTNRLAALFCCQAILTKGGTYQLCNCPGSAGIVYQCTLTIPGEFSMSSAIESRLVIESFDTLASRPVI